MSTHKTSLYTLVCDYATRDYTCPEIFTSQEDLMQHDTRKEALAYGWSYGIFGRDYCFVHSQSL